MNYLTELKGYVKRGTSPWQSSRDEAWNIFQAVGLVRMESCLAQAVLPLVGLAADKITRDWYISAREKHGMFRGP